MPFTRTMLSVTGAVAPPLAAEIAFAAWRSLGTPEPVHPRDRAIHDEARTGVLEVGGERVVTYAWGDGPRVILLVHGWRSRASRFSALVERLRSPEHTIVAFDAPGNGDSAGRGTTILDYAHVIRLLVARHGTPEAIVAHSFGALATFLAVREGVPAKRIACVAGMSGAEQILAQFGRQAGIRGRAVRALRQRIERRAFPEIIDPWRRFVAEIDPADTHVPLLLVHDADDDVVPVTELSLIAEAHTGEVRTLVTAGLGHNRVLRDPEVVEAIAAFTSRVPGAGTAPGAGVAAKA